MFLVTNYLLAHPPVALGLAILVLLCIYNILRKQARVAMGLWLVVMVVLFYVYRQAVAVDPTPISNPVEIRPDG